MKFKSYDTEGFYDELFLSDGHPRPGVGPLIERIESLAKGDLSRRQRAAERNLKQMGITFNVYGESQSQEHILPFDLVPRLVSAEDWEWIERGLRQRIQALNLFIDDIYHEQKIVQDKVIPRQIIESAAGFRTPCMGLDPPAASGVTSLGRTSFVTLTANFTFSKTTCAFLRGFPTYCKIGRF